MLELDRVAASLREWGLIDAGCVVDDELTITCVARRNRNFRVDRGDGRGWFIKQPYDPAEGGLETLRRESAFHHFCRDEPAAAPIVRFLPRLLESRDEGAVLVFELVSGARTLESRLRDEPALGRVVPAARAFGAALATVHRVFGRMVADEDRRLGWLPRDRPAVPTLHEPPPELLADLSGGNLETLRIIQASEVLGAHLDHSRRSWRADTVIHGDVKLDHVLARAPRGGDDPDAVEIWLVDWEMVGIGDPAWDLAGALQDVLVAWVGSMPLSGQATAETLSAGARLPLARLQESIRAVWDGYREAIGLGPAEAEALLARGVAFAAARLIQSAYEHAADADRLPGGSVLLLQIAENVAADPARARLQLFGIPPEDPTS